jgi:hypothetical protein
MEINKYYLLIFIFSIFHIVLFYIIYNSNISFENNLLFFKKIIKTDLNLSTANNSTITTHISVLAVSWIIPILLIIISIMDGYFIKSLNLFDNISKLIKPSNIPPSGVPPPGVPPPGVPPPGVPPPGVPPPGVPPPGVPPLDVPSDVLLLDVSPEIAPESSHEIPSRIPFYDETKYVEDVIKMAQKLIEKEKHDKEIEERERIERERIERERIENEKKELIELREFKKKKDCEQLEMQNYMYKELQRLSKYKPIYHSINGYWIINTRVYKTIEEAYEKALQL